jgi:preprotein translocase subunit Sec61beta
VYSTTGVVGISIAFGLITWAGFWVMYHQVRRQPWVIVGIGLAIAAVAGSPIWGPRAQMITFFFTCLELYWLQGYLSGRSRALNVFPLLMILWANLHGGWVIGFVWLGVALGAELLGWAWDRSNPAHRAHVRFLAIITVFSVVAVAATPHGFSLYPYPFQTQGSVAQQKLIVEWFSPDFHEVYLRPFEAMIFLTIIGFTLRRPSLYEFLLTLTALGLALQSVRNVVLFVAAATPVLINCYSAYWKELSQARGWKLELPPRAIFAVATAIVLVVIVLATALRITDSINPDKQRSLVAASYPVGAADWLAAHPEVGTRMYNQYGWGGYLADRFYPDPNRKVFIFGEAALMGDPLLNQYEDVQTLRTDWKQVLDQYKVDYVVYNKGEALANVLATQPEWTLVYQDSVAVIYVRTAPA